MTFAFTPGCCCKHNPEGECLYVGQYSPEVLDRWLSHDFRTDRSRPIPWYVPVKDPRDPTTIVWRKTYERPVIEYVDMDNNRIGPAPFAYTWYEYAGGGSPWSNEGYYQCFGNTGLMHKHFAGGMSLGPRWYEYMLPDSGIFPQNRNTWGYHPWFLQVLGYHSVPGYGIHAGSGGMSMHVLPLEHTTGSAAIWRSVLDNAFCVSPGKTSCRYISIALVPYLRKHDAICLIDCGLYECPCSEHIPGELLHGDPNWWGGSYRVRNIACRNIKTIVPYGAKISEVNFVEIGHAISKREAMPDGGYFLVFGSHPDGPGHYIPGEGPRSEVLAYCCITGAAVSELGDYIQPRHMNSGWFCGLYQCGRPFFHTTRGEPGGTWPRIEMWYQGCEIETHHSNNSRHGPWYNLQQPTVIRQDCPPTPAGLISRCRYASPTNRHWGKCTSCMVIECNHPLGFESEIGFVGVGESRFVDGRLEVRSRMCNKTHCRNYTAREI